MIVILSDHLIKYIVDKRNHSLSQSLDASTVVPRRISDAHTNVWQLLVFLFYNSSSRNEYWIITEERIFDWYIQLCIAQLFDNMNIFIVKISLKIIIGIYQRYGVLNKWRNKKKFTFSITYKAQKLRSLFGFVPKKKMLDRWWFGQLLWMRWHDMVCYCCCKIGISNITHLEYWDKTYERHLCRP